MLVVVLMVRRRARVLLVAECGLFLEVKKNSCTKGDKTLIIELLKSVI